MAKVTEATLRAEFAQLKAQYERLSGGRQLPISLDGEPKRRRLTPLVTELQDALATLEHQFAEIRAERSIRRNADGLGSPLDPHHVGDAESILQRCLAARGWATLHQRGELAGEQCLALLEDVREYGRAWLRREAEALFSAYGGGNGVGGGARNASGPGITRSLDAVIHHHVGRFFRRAKQFTRELVLAGMLALSGPAPLDEQDLAEADRFAVVQEGFFDRFEAEVNGSPPVGLVPAAPFGPAGMTIPQFIARAESYGGSVWQAVLNNDRRGVIVQDGLAVRERRLHRNPNPEVHACKTCLDASNAGWSALGSLPGIGDSECLGVACDCFFVYEMRDGSTFITRRGWRR
jgi:hypothetical protein